VVAGYLRHDQWSVPVRGIFLALAICAAAAACAAEAPPPVALTGQEFNRYEAVMRKALAAELKVTVREVRLCATTFQVSYEDCNEQESHAFILAAVLTLASPLAARCKDIRVSGLSAGRRLWDVSGAAQDLRSLYLPELKDGEEARLQQLARSVLWRARLGTPQAVEVAPVAPTAD